MSEETEAVLTSLYAAIAEAGDYFAQHGPLVQFAIEQMQAPYNLLESLVEGVESNG